MDFFERLHNSACLGQFDRNQLRNQIKIERLAHGLDTYSTTETVARAMDVDGAWSYTDKLKDKFGFTVFLKEGVLNCLKMTPAGIPFGLIGVTPSPRGVSFYVCGERAFCEELLDYIKQEDCDTNSVRIGVASLTKGYVTCLPTLLEVDGSLSTSGNYPYMSVNMDTIFADFLEDSASVLLLIGEPGTGKTEWLKEQIIRHQVRVMVAADPAVISSASLYEYYAQTLAYDLLVVEDCDNHLTAREKGNNAMYSILATGNGLIKPPKKKMIFSTNLPSVEDVDKALLRPGRCYDVLNFKKLTGAQANVIIDKHFPGTEELDVDGMFTLAEVFNRRKRGEMAKRRSIGFV